MPHAALLAGVLGIASTFALPAHASSSAQQQIQFRMDEQLQAANAHDTDRFLASYRHSDALIFIVNGQLIRGYRALRAQQLQWWQNGKSDAAYRLDGPSTFLALAPDTMLVTEPLASRRTGPDGRPREGHFILSMIWQQSREGWQVTYAHESWRPQP